LTEQLVVLGAAGNFLVGEFSSSVGRCLGGLGDVEGLSAFLDVELTFLTRAHLDGFAVRLDDGTMSTSLDGNSSRHSGLLRRMIATMKPNVLTCGVNRCILGGNAGLPRDDRQTRTLTLPVSANQTNQAIHSGLA
jgi:hypothetical protein